MAEASSTTPQVVKLDICDYGDMCIDLKTAKVHASFTVSSHQLCVSSSVFRAMLGPKSSFSEAVALRAQRSTEELYHLEVSDHDPTALAVVLYALHARSDFIPETIAFEELLEIAYVCDYYDCATAMKPWDKGWLAHWKEYVEKPGYEGWLFLAWVFRDQEVFGTLTKSFSWNAVFEDGEFGVVVKTDPREVARMDEHIPQAIIDAMGAQRTMPSQDIIRACRDLYDLYDDDSRPKCVYTCNGLQQQKNCDQFIYGGLHKGFRKLHLFTPDDEELSKITLSMLVNELRTFITALIYKQTNEIMYAGSWHSDCITFSSILVKLDAALEHIRPLDLKAFEKSSAKVKLPSSWQNVLVNGNSANTAGPGKREEGELAEFLGAIQV